MMANYAVNGHVATTRQPGSNETDVLQKPNQDKDEACCFGPCHSLVWQKCAKVKVFLLNFTVVLVILSIFSTYQIGTIIYTFN